MSKFEFATAARIVFGAGSVREVAPAVKETGTRALVVTGVRGAPIVEGVPFPVDGEPTVDLVRHGLKLLRQERCDVVVSVGGGSAIDAGKAIAILATNGGDPLDYLEVVGRGQPLVKPGLPFIAVPTTAGTGSEVTRNAVLEAPEQKVKASLRSPLMLARLAVVDPELTLGLPPEITASTGMDALTQVIEPYVSARANAMVDLFCVEGIKRAARSLERAWRDGSNLEARTDMSMASLMGGLCLANAGLGAVHGFAAPVGGMFDAPHGAVCAALLPHVMEANLRALRARAPESGALAKYREVARILTAREDARAEDGVEWTRRIRETLRIPPLGAYGIGAGDVPAIVEKAAKASSMKGNPVALTTEELTEVLMKAL